MIPTAWPIGKMLKGRGKELVRMCKHKFLKNLYRRQCNKGLEIGRNKG
jgi:hypothetical protein